MRLLAETGSMLSTDMKRRVGSGSFDAVMTALQMQTYVCVQSFDQRLNKQGQPYGWDVTRYTLPENLMAPGAMDAAYMEAPEKAFARMADHLQAILPDVPRDAVEKWLR